MWPAVVSAGDEPGLVAAMTYWLGGSGVATGVTTVDGNVGSAAVAVIEQLVQGRDLENAFHDSVRVHQR